jgi:hypothetical protein
MNWKWDVDTMSYMQVERMIKNEGYNNIKCLWYWDPKFSFSRGLRSLNNDGDVLKFIEDIKGFDVVDVYVEHTIDNPIIEDAQAEDVATDGWSPTNVGNDGDVDIEVLSSDSDVDIGVESKNAESADAQDIDVEAENVASAGGAEDYESVDDGEYVASEQEIDDDDDDCDSLFYNQSEDRQEILAMVYKIASRRPTKYFTKTICIHLRPAEGSYLILMH